MSANDPKRTSLLGGELSPLFRDRFGHGLPQCAALIWVPAAIYLLATGSVWQGVVLLMFGAFVIGLVDNVLRPLLVGKDTKMPNYVVLISTLRERSQPNCYAAVIRLQMARNGLT
jgi:AI-2E family transporter